MAADDDRTRELGPTRPVDARFDAGETLPALPEIALPAGGRSSPALRVGTRVGRYLLEEELGRGGMGVVFAAHDPELDRRIAIKLLRTRVAEGSAGRARLQREAQALARLAHPNVIAVFDVGSTGDEVFVAMELCTGGTLRAHQQGRPWRAIVEAYLQAGRGLAAAHAAGLVHRDFKPDNVLVGADGRLRVTDFGLVRASGDAPVTAASPASSDVLSSDLTEHGSVVGTPMYMAPEQMTGAPVEAAADQFSFAVALWQALHGAPPFLGGELPERLEAIQAGRRAEPSNRAVPARINRALARALAAEPAARWPSLAALLDELARAIRPRTPWLAGGAALVAAGGLAAAIALTTRAGDAPCARSGDAGAGLWSARRAEVEAAFRATGASYAATSFATLDRRLGALERGWKLGATAACEDTRVRHVQSSALLDLRMACLVTRRHRVAAIVDELARADRALLDRLPVVLDQLPRLDDCADGEGLAGTAPRPTDPDRLTALTALEQRIAELDARMDLRRGGDGASAARATADQLVEQARTAGYVPALAGALLARASVRTQLDDAAGARTDLIDAAAAATRGGDREALAAAYLELLFLDTTVRGDLPGADQWAALADAAVDALGDPAERRADLTELRAELIRAKGDPAAAAALVEQALADPALAPEPRRSLQADLARLATDLGQYARAAQILDALIPATAEALGADHGRVLGLRHDLANLLYYRGEFAACARAHGELVAARTRTHGADSVQVAASLQALGVCENKGGQNLAAREHLERSVAIYRAARGADHPDTLMALSDLGGAYSHGGDHARSAQINRELLATRERTLGPDHIDTAVTLVNLAIELKNQGQVDEAIALQRRAVDVFARTLGPEHPNVGIALINLGESLRAARQLDDAIATFERAGRVISAGFGPEHVLMTHVWYGLGETERARGHARAAIAWLERAVSGRARSDADAEPNELAEARFALAQALAAAGGDRARARSLAQQAIDAWKQLGANFDDDRAAAQTWLAATR